MAELGKAVLLMGVILVFLGLLLTFAERSPMPIGRLPGDIVIKRDGMTFYFPIVTSLLLSVILTIALNLILGLKR